MQIDNKFYAEVAYNFQPSRSFSYAFLLVDFEIFIFVFHRSPSLMPHFMVY